MRVFITGAYGFLGSHIVAGLLSKGHEVIGCGRDLAYARTKIPSIEWIHGDLAKDVRPEDWLDHLKDVDVLVNCAGLLQSTRAQSVEDVHLRGPAALFEAAERAGIRRVVQISALGTHEEGATDYARSKAAGDNELKARDLDWVVLRPSIVYGHGSYGGTSLFRGLAAFPGFIPVALGERLMQPIAMSDFVDVVCDCVETEKGTGQVIDLVGPEPISLIDMLKGYRRWLGIGDAPVWRVPAWMMGAIARIADLAAWAGAHTSLTTTSLKQLDRGNTSDPAPMRRVFSIEPKPFDIGLASMPSGIADRWHARLYFAKPALVVLLSFFWILSGAVPLLGSGIEWPLEKGLRELFGGGLFTGLKWATCLLDVVLGFWLLSGAKRRLVLALQIFVSLAYLVFLTAFAPVYWLDPIAPVLKILPIIGLTAVLMMIEGER